LFSDVVTEAASGRFDTRLYDPPSPLHPTKKAEEDVDPAVTAKKGLQGPAAAATAARTEESRPLLLHDARLEKLIIMESINTVVSTTKAILTGILFGQNL
jgi:hypothetical protein